MTPELVSLLTVTTIWLNASSVSTFRDLWITSWFANMLRILGHLKSVPTIAGIRSNALALFARRITHGFTLRGRPVPIPRQTGTHSNTCTISKNTIRITNGNTAIPTQPESLLTSAPIRRNTPTANASSLTNRSTLAPRVLLEPFAALLLRFRPVSQLAGVRTVARLDVDLVPLAPANVVARRCSGHVLVAPLDVRHSERGVGAFE